MIKPLAALAFAIASTTVVQAQNYPSHPIAMIVPFPAGSAFDVAARVLAEKALTEGGATTEQKITFAFRRLTGRAPEPDELKVIQEVLKDQTEIFQQEPDRAAKLIAVGERKRDPALSPVELAAMTAVTQTIMNLDATVWKR